MRQWILHIIIISLLVLAFPAGSDAGSGVSFGKTSGTGAFMEICKKEIKPGKFTGNIIRCMDKIMKTGADRVLATYVKFFASIVYYSVILAIMFHGIKMMFGAANNHGITVMLIIKLVVVLYFCSLSGFQMLKNTRDTLINFPKAMSVVILVPDKLTLLAEITTPVVPGYWSDQLFDKLDTQFCKLLGGGDNDIAPGDKNFTDDQRDAASEKKCISISTGSPKFIGIVALAAGLFFTGAMGLTIAMIVLTYLAAALFLVAQMVFFFVMISIAINFLMALAPLALACMLFQPTVRITKTWFNFLIIYSIQPIILAAFISFLVTVLHKTDEKTQKYYKALEDKYLGSGTTRGAKVTLSNCLGLKKSGDLSERTKTYFDKSGQHYMDIGLNEYDKACDLEASGIKLDKKVKAVVAGIGLSSSVQGQLTEADIRSLLAIKLGLIIFMILMVSFLKKMPEIVNKMVGGGAPSILGAAGRPMDKLINIDGGSMVEKLGRFGGGLAKRQ